jgi:hypothetical protein
MMCMGLSININIKESYWNVEHGQWIIRLDCSRNGRRWLTTDDGWNGETQKETSPIRTNDGFREECSKKGRSSERSLNRRRYEFQQQHSHEPFIYLPSLDLKQIKENDGSDRRCYLFIRVVILRRWNKESIWSPFCDHDW